jgi:hypothetical protein
MGPLGDGPDAVGPVVHGVHGGHHREEDLRRADVGGRPVTTDVLLPGLEREAERRVAVGVDRHADQPAGQVALEAVAHGHVAGVGPAETHRHTEALRAADHHVGPHLTGRDEQGERQDVGGDRHARPDRMGGGDDGGEVAHPPARPRVLHEHAGDRELGKGLVEIDDHEGAPGRLDPRPHDGDRLREAVLVDDDHTLRAGPPQEGDGLGGRGRLVEQ